MSNANRCPCLDGRIGECTLKNIPKEPWSDGEAVYARLKGMPAVANAPKDLAPAKKEKKQ